MKKISEKPVVNKSQGKQLVEQLVRDFSDNQEYFLSEQFNETEVRNRFIDPFFKALGWEFDQTHLSPEFWDVHREYSQKEGSVNKKPDYAFRIDGKLKFFTEAKAPHIRLEDKNPAHQAKRYAFSTSGKAPVVILTNFHKLKVFNALERPVHNNPLQGLLEGFDLDYLQYPKKWDFLYSHFSKQAVYSGSLDVLARKISKNTRKMDDEFLDDISRWREQMAVKLADLNQKMNEDGLNEAVQRILDRMIFLRNLEDRDLETENTLLKIAQGDAPAYPQLVKIFNGLNEFYNGLLFKPHFSEDIRVDDKLIKTVIRQICYPESPFRFDVIEPEILGHIYERFLGSEIRLIAKSKAVVEEKPEVRKAGGVYYTPQYIVDYIVRNTVGEKIEGMTPEEIRAVKILDPACGSGSFLLGAFDILIKYHEKWYDRHRKNKDYRHDFYAMPDGKVKLTPAKKADILKKNIFGVDIDREATEVAMMSLYLKLMDNSVSKNQMELMTGHVLPDLTCNIKCGNSLIGSDFYNSQERLSFEEQKRINALDWEKEFADIMKSGGFDCVIGNPPWISLSGKFGNYIHSQSEIRYLIKRFKGNTYMPNMYEYFVAQGLNLTKSNGFFGFIVPDRLGFNDQFIQLRRRILTESKILSLVYKAPFPFITADTLLFILQKGEFEKKHLICISEHKKHELHRLQTEILEHPDYKFEYFEDTESMKIITKIDSLPKIKKINDICSSTSGFGGKSTLIRKVKNSPDQIPALKGNSIGRYEMREKYWFDFKKENITGRTTDINKLGAVPKILLRKTGDRIIATYDTSKIFPEQSLYFLYENKVETDFKYLLGILNSNLLTYYYRAKSLTNKKSIAQVKKKDLDQLPIYDIDFSVSADKVRHDKMLELVERMLSLHKQLSQAKSSKDKDILKRQIDLTDSEIDRLVYKLYDLTPDEIEVVEENA